MVFDFKEQYIAFLDILGFKNLVNAKKFQQEIEHTFGCIEQAITKAKDTKQHNIYPQDKNVAVSVFSDSIILSIPTPSDEIEKLKTMRLLFSVVEKIQYDLALRNIWIRGGISRGPLSHVEGNVVGPGFVKAYQIEMKAIYPRVVVDSHIFDDLSENRRRNQCEIINQINYEFMNPEYSGKFLFDWRKFQPKRTFVKDQWFFIDYLNPLLDKHNEAVTAEAALNRAKIITNIGSMISTTEFAICQKFSWICDYLRSIVEHEILCLRNLNRRTSDGFGDGETEEAFKKRSDYTHLTEFLEQLNKF